MTDQIRTVPPDPLATGARNAARPGLCGLCAGPVSIGHRVADVRGAGVAHVHCVAKAGDGHVLGRIEPKIRPVAAAAAPVPASAPPAELDSPVSEAPPAELEIPARRRERPTRKRRR